MRNSTFSFPDSIKDAIKNMKTRDSVMSENLWSSIMDTVYYGMCHTFTFTDRVYADMVTDGFLFYLDPSLSYRVTFTTRGGRVVLHSHWSDPSEIL